MRGSDTVPRLAAVVLVWLTWSASTGGGVAEERNPSASAPATSATKKSTQTHPAHTRPTQTRRAQTHPASSQRPSPGGKPISFTNEDLKRFHSDDATRPAAKTTSPPTSQDPLKRWKDEAERERWRQARTAELQRKVQDLEAKLKFLQQKRLSIHNPLVPRPAEPEGTRQAESGRSGPELLAQTDEEIRQTTQQLEAARKALATFLDSASQ